MPTRLRETARLIHSLTTISGGPMVFVVREVWHPPTDVYETEDAIIVCVEIAGMDENDLHITLTGDMLSIYGRRANSLAGYTSVHRLEMHYGDFETTIHLPTRILSDEVEAVYKNGLLYVTLPKLQRRILIKAESEEKGALESPPIS